MNAINLSGLSGISSARRSMAKQDVRDDAAQVANAKPTHTAKQVGSTNSSVDIAGKLAEMPQITKRNLQFSIDGDTGESVFRVIDSSTGELIRQIPSEQVLHIIEQVQEAQGATVLGMLLDDST